MVAKNVMYEGKCWTLDWSEAVISSSQANIFCKEYFELFAASSFFVKVWHSRIMVES